MSEWQVIENALRRTCHRRRWHCVWQGLWQGLFLGAALWLVTLGLYKVLPLPDLTLSVGGVLACLVVLAGAVRGAWRTLTLSDTARWVDQKQHFQERLSTALEVNSAPTAGRWRELLLADAARCAARLDPRQLLPFQVPKSSRWILLLLVISAGLGFAPEYRSQSYRQKQHEAEVIRDVGRQLAEVTRQFAKYPVATATTRQDLESVINLGDHLSQAKLTRSDALRDLASVTDKLKQDALPLARNPTLKRLEQAARSPASQKSSAAATALQKKIDDLQKSLGKQSANTDALQKFKNELQKAREAAAGMASQNADGDSAAREQLSQSLAALAQKAQDLGLMLPDLQEAMEALAANQAELLVRDLDTALKDLEKVQAMAQALQQLQQQAEGLAKELAEQLRKGQAQAAQANLEKMVQQLKSGALTPEELKRILEEVAKAVEPAGEYGKVAELLQQGVGQMQQNQRPAAAQSLAEAAKELEDMLAEMGDLEALKATLAALQKASMCIGEGQCWGQGKKGLARAGRNSSRGAGGFGTWAEEEGWMSYPEMSELWENPPDTRGAMDPRSATDRGDGQLADNLDPTKIRGQISPGGSMPSITLKGVSIKGQSTVAFQEAALSAQSDAQNALSQEQIPRAYQGAVKDYFDDLAK